jgi:hypothetical protein
LEGSPGDTIFYCGGGFGWLEKRLGGLTATDIVTLAVADLYERRRGEFRTRLQKVKEMYILSVRGISIAGMGAKDCDSLPGRIKAEIASGSHNALVDLVLSAHKKKGTSITIFPEGMKQVYGFEVGNYRLKIRPDCFFLFSRPWLC